MREILFRAKAKDKKTEEWIEGFPVRIYDYGGKVWEIHPFETNFNAISGVLPETICEFTGKLDKNKKKIFEGDICKSIDGLFLIRWDSAKAAFVMDFYDYPQETLYLEEMQDDTEIIGNIHDNPELLKGY